MKRRRLFIDPQVQGALAMRLVLHWFVFLGVTMMLVTGLMWLSDPVSPFTVHVGDALRSYGPVFLVFACLTPMFVYDSMKLSNRFAGPIFRMHRTVRELADGREAEPIRLRKGDFWKGLAADLNRVIDRQEALAERAEAAQRVPEQELIPAGAED